MARFKISEAAKLVNIDRKTLYKHIHKGRVSAGVDDAGQKYIDAAELHRAYGNFDTSGVSLATVGDTSATAETATLATVVEELRKLQKNHLSVLEELKLMRQDLAERPLLEDKTKRPAPTSKKDKHQYSSIIQKLKESQVH